MTEFSKTPSNQPLKPIAHVTYEDMRAQDLENHLVGVAEIAAGMAESFGAREWGYFAGLWHDTGKFRDDFQRYIRMASGYEKEKANGAPGRVDHSTAGALMALRELGNGLGRLLAYPIAGHHAGLPDWSAADGHIGTLEARIREGGRLLEESCPDFEMRAANHTLLREQLPGSGVQGLHLWIRMLYSCLTDAEFLDTEAFLQPEQSSERGAFPAIGALREKFESFIQQMTEQAQASELNCLRSEILAQCREKAMNSPGIYTLSVPTGGGKTLSSLAFALDHAVKYGKSRIVYAIPYTSIIEQTADVYRKIFGDVVIEHHSNLTNDMEEEGQYGWSRKRRLATENWDAPLIVTTNVQLFESLFAARSSRCRKLHNLVNSVVVLDEAQMLPPGFLQPIVDVIRLLSAQYGITFVLCTATQPALHTQKRGHDRMILRGLDSTTEIVKNPQELAGKLKRVQIHVPENLERGESWDALAEKISAHSTVLGIVNRRRDCRELHRRMPQGTIHLSAQMCGEHRSVVIAQIRQQLAQGKPLRVVSTQLIEAGVDVDFPVVYRALAGIDSIAQAAGRCNREGKLRCGDVFVFCPPEPAPRGLLRFGEETSRALLREDPKDFLSPEVFTRYFQFYYARVAESGNLDSKGIVDLLEKGASRGEIQFREAADRFRLMDEENSVSVLVPYANPLDTKKDSRILLARLRAGELHRGLMRQLQRYSVSVPLQVFKRLRQSNDIEEIIPEMYALCNETLYHHALGLLSEEQDSADSGTLYC